MKFLLVIAIFVCAPAIASAAVKGLVISPIQSYLTIDFKQLDGQTISHGQAAQSNTTSLYGMIWADIQQGSTNSIQFLPSSEIQFFDNELPMRPLANGDHGKSPAQYGWMFNSGTLLTGFAAARDLVATVDSAAIELDGSLFYPAGSMDVSLTDGLLSYDLSANGSPLVGSTDIFYPAVNQISFGSLTSHLGYFELTLPISLQFPVSVNGVELMGVATGLIHAYHVPEPSAWTLGVLGLLPLAYRKLQRRKKRR